MQRNQEQQKVARLHVWSFARICTRGHVCVCVCVTQSGSCDKVVLIIVWYFVAALTCWSLSSRNLVSSALVARASRSSRSRSRASTAPCRACFSLSSPACIVCSFSLSCWMRCFEGELSRWLISERDDSMAQKKKKKIDLLILKVICEARFLTTLKPDLHHVQLLGSAAGCAASINAKKNRLKKKNQIKIKAMSGAGGEKKKGKVRPRATARPAARNIVVPPAAPPPRDAPRGRGSGRGSVLFFFLFCFVLFCFVLFCFVLFFVFLFFFFFFSFSTFPHTHTCLTCLNFPKIVVFELYYFNENLIRKQSWKAVACEVSGHRRKGIAKF
jgi:hypothetical protein